MPYLPLRKIDDRSTRGLATEWLEALADSLAALSAADRALLASAVPVLERIVRGSHD